MFFPSKPTAPGWPGCGTVGSKIWTLGVDCGRWGWYYYCRRRQALLFVEELLKLKAFALLGAICFRLHHFSRPHRYDIYPCSWPTTLDVAILECLNSRIMMKSFQMTKSKCRWSSIPSLKNRTEGKSFGSLEPISSRPASWRGQVDRSRICNHGRNYWTDIPRTGGELSGSKW